MERKNLERLEATKEDIAKVKSTLTLVERVIPSLRKILRSAESARPKLRDSLVSLSAQRSFHLLPNEVLAIIFEFSAHDNPNMSTQLSRVSRRFRDISLRLPDLWTTLTSHKLLDDSRSRYFCSGQRPLTVSICAHQGQLVAQERAFSLFNFAMSASWRLRSLDLNIRLKTDGAFFMRFLAQYPILIFPALESLSFACTAIADDECVMMIVNAKPFLNWVLPSLRKIRMQNFIPTFAPVVHSQITSCSLTYGDAPIRGVYWILENALRFAASLPQLSDLEVHMLQAYFHPLPPDFKVLLPKLSKLTIESDVHDINYLAFLASAIHAPTCKTFSLNLVISQDEQHQLWVMAALNNCKQRLPNVEEFDLVVRKRQIFRKVLVNLVLGEFPRLRSLGFDGIDFDYTSTNAFFPPLRNIRLKNVKNIDHTFFFDFIENSRGPFDSLENLESVAFENCKDVELDEIQELISKERVTWLE
jgi:hypothetical protein